MDTFKSLITTPVIRKEKTRLYQWIKNFRIRLLPPVHVLRKHFTLPLIMGLLFLIIPGMAHATQMHSASEGILVHQMGHLFFLISMGVLIITIQGKKLHQERGWRLIQYSALFFILWNLDAIGAHLLDNQTDIISTTLVSITHMRIENLYQNEAVAWLYYLLRMDHLLCLPAMMLMYRGLSHLLKGKNGS